MSTLLNKKLRCILVAIRANEPKILLNSVDNSSSYIFECCTANAMYSMRVEFRLYHETWEIQLEDYW